ncbi:hypothetical protein HAX54_020850 [Datura stramonium]|uniref:Uncharacterized protein n=1 Tax=Datura stramonium TaxID=4076 RepID=A0ABS8URU4_DATST|nr:hypothetical protein [Datura stramonium]
MWLKSGVGLGLEVEVESPSRGWVGSQSRVGVGGRVSGSRLGLEVGVRVVSRVGVSRESESSLSEYHGSGTRVSPLIKSSTDLEISLLGVVSNLKKSVKDRNFKLRTAQTSINTICWVAIFQGLYKPV